jgi:hypothetical protein
MDNRTKGLVILFWVVCGIWIYTDARSRKVKNPATWGIIGTLFGVFGVFGYWFWVILPSRKTKDS